MSVYSGIFDRYPNEMNCFLYEVHIDDIIFLMYIIMNFFLYLVKTGLNHKIEEMLLTLSPAKTLELTRSTLASAILEPTTPLLQESANKLAAKLKSTFLSISIS